MKPIRPLIAAFCAVALAVPAAALACPFCEAPSLTLSEQVEQSDAVVLVKWISAVKPKRFNPDPDAKPEEIAAAKAKTIPASTTLEVVEVIRAAGEETAKGKRITLPRYREGRKGDLFLLFGVKGRSFDWGSPLDVTQAGVNYIKKAPGSKASAETRLAYFVNYLEFPDPLVANDAYSEFANAPYEDIVKVKGKFPKERLRRWVADPDITVTRLGLYGLLLGLCGDEKDAELMRKKVVADADDFRLGIDGVMSGYLLLTGEKGLKVLEETKLDKDVKVPFSETYSAMRALRFMWDYEGGQIKKERLRQSMRLLLDRSELADLVIADLARWKDWSIQDKLMGLYDKEGYDIPSIKRAIVRYMLVCSKDKGKDDENNPPSHVVSAKKHLATLREKDPVIVKQAERFFFD